VVTGRSTPSRNKKGEILSNPSLFKTTAKNYFFFLGAAFLTGAAFLAGAFFLAVAM
jgi:hypothetical protein